MKEACLTINSVSKNNNGIDADDKYAICQFINHVFLM